MRYCLAWKRRKQQMIFVIILQNCTRTKHFTTKFFLMSKSTSVTEHINTLNTLFSQLTSLCYKIETNKRAELLLQSLPDLYHQLIINLTNTSTKKILVFDDIAAAILEEENWHKNREDRLVSSQQAEALTVVRRRLTECNSSESQNYGRSKSRRKKNLKCYHCGKKGHLKKDC